VKGGFTFSTRIGPSRKRAGKAKMSAGIRKEGGTVRPQDRGETRGKSKKQAGGVRTLLLRYLYVGNGLAIVQRYS